MLVDLQVLVTNGESERIIREFKATTLDALCLVGFKKFPDPQTVAEVRGAGIKTFVGVEIPLSKGHLLAYPHDAAATLSEVLEKNLEDEEIITQCRSAGCAVVACHPYHKDSTAAMGDRVFQYRGLDAVIVVTSVSPIPANDMAIEALEAVGSPAAGGSATAAPEGRCATLFVTNIESQEQLVDELRTGDFWAVALGNEDRWSVHEDDGNRGFRRDGGRDGGRDRGGDRGGYRGGPGRPDNRGGRPGGDRGRFNDRGRDRGDRFSGGPDRRGSGQRSGPRGNR